MVILHAPTLFRMLSLGSRRHHTMALWPFILTSLPKNHMPVRVKRHEIIHLRQQIELLILPFYLWYGLEYLWHRLRHDSYTAYRMIRFEREAWANDGRCGYLRRRKPWNWIWQRYDDGLQTD